MAKHINEKIGAWLLEDGNTRDILAEKLGMSRPSLNSRIQGSSKWYFEEVVRLSKLVGCSVSELAD